ncbi:MFS transporter [Candidatus Cyanaurora vandensis]|uniref:MFS transporter n=1 Tax=Candidatus Cyanaurora vandensis TaxID=2714958 RepID=UPI00257BF2E1|nr:MFS transporter [Candidatus Cyanaurora vandensis]
MDRRAIIVLTAGHLSLDLNQGVLPALLPFLIAERHFSYATAATLVLVFTLVSSLVQPIFGQLADQRPAPWLMPFGLLATGTGIALTGVFADYGLLLLAMGLGGIGSAAFHPEAARMVNRVAASQRATGMSWFSVGGNLGFALGPLLATTLLLSFGLAGMVWMLVPACLMAGLVGYKFQAARVTPGQSAVVVPSWAVDHWGPFICLSAMIVCRSIVFFGLNTFLPLYFVDVLGQSKVLGGLALTVFLIFGAVGTLLGGWSADHYGRQWVIWGSLGLLPFFLLLFLTLPGVGLATACLVPLGLVLFAPMSVMVVMGQEYLPRRVGMASGVTMGLAGSIGGLATPLLGWLADQYGIHSALLALIPFGVLAAGLALQLPKSVRVSQA